MGDISTNFRKIEAVQNTCRSAWVGEGHVGMTGEVVGGMNTNMLHKKTCFRSPSRTSRGQSEAASALWQGAHHKRPNVNNWSYALAMPIKEPEADDTTH